MLKADCLLSVFLSGEYERQRGVGGNVQVLGATQSHNPALPLSSFVTIGRFSRLLCALVYSSAKWE